MDTLFEFTAPYDQRTTREAILACLAKIDKYHDARGNLTLKPLIESPLLASQYIAAENDNSFTITAGNRIETFWSVTISWSPRNLQTTQGTVKVDRPRDRIETWTGDVIQLALQLPDILQLLCSFEVRGVGW